MHGYLFFPFLFLFYSRLPWLMKMNVSTAVHRDTGNRPISRQHWCSCPLHDLTLCAQSQAHVSSTCTPSMLCPSTHHQNRRPGRKKHTRTQLCSHPSRAHSRVKEWRKWKVCLVYAWLVFVFVHSELSHLQKVLLCMFCTFVWIIYSLQLQIALTTILRYSQ